MAPEELALNLDGSPPTPSVNDTLYLRYAIDQLTRYGDIRQVVRSADAGSEASYPVERVRSVPADENLVYDDPFRERRARRQAAADRPYAASPEPEGKEIYSLHKIRDTRGVLEYWQ